ncbi:LysM peptidoglycan-binding domain-containing protein [Sphingobacterium thalpophilum]|uniref:LysM peptidoglycan-binding domain-containing protein n=2 Tax=Sphingobacterium thalpophilum TaxID=259 RepID=A0A4U9W6M2_9SPHI|nr:MULTISPECIES: LysM domain-containing protein [Sphingobacterium]MCW8314119.1 LysM peptidoglycan-binding domain-containing protein [Sphingobacterium sp. InxBP1]VTR54443.1 Peptidoglycan endopeptidase LytF precursor [Sphingobacterium thalpophilum]
MKVLFELNTYKKIAMLSMTMLAFQHLEAKNFRFPSLTAAPDSIGTDVINGEEYVLFKIEKGDNYYQLSKRYRTTVSQLTKINGNGTLSIGQIVKVPTGRKPAPARSKSPMDNIPLNPRNPQQGFTEYIVGEKETLYAISKRFSISVEDIKKANNLKNNIISGGMKLMIPNEPLPPERPKLVEPKGIEVVTPDSTGEDDKEENQITTNRYGIREKSERGIGVWIEGLSSQGTSNLALHKSAPVGTILKITNPMTKSVTYAKVVGKFNDNAENQNAIVVLSKSAAASIGALDKRFQVEIAYGLPLEN